MSVKTGDRATFRGESGIVMGPAPFLGENRWFFRYRNGEADTGWSMEIAPESGLSAVTTPTFTVGQSVKVGFAPPGRRKATVTAITQEGGRAIYEVEYPEDDQTYETEGGVHWIVDAHGGLVGAEFLDI